jgi:O-antigen/teichoic acid export membrane protein
MTEADRAGGLRATVLRGLSWKVVSQVTLQSSRLVVAVLLARLLTPDEYGLAGMVLIFGSFVFVFSDLALGAALVQRRRLTELDSSTVFWTSLCAGLVFTAVGIALAEPVARFYDEPRVRPLFAALALSFVVTSLGTTQTALLTRAMSFRQLEIRLMAGTVAGAAVGIGVALAGYGPWAIVAQHLTVASVSTTLLWVVSPWRPRWSFSWSSLRTLGGFSVNVFGQRFLYYLHANADKLLIGRFLGAPALGAYALAYNVVLVPFSRIGVPVAEVLFPAFARLQDERDRMVRAWIRATRLVATAAVPALLGLIAVAPDFVKAVLGERWLDAAPVIQLLAWVGLLQSLQTLNGSILQALDRTGTLLRYSVVFFLAHLCAFVVGLRWGIIGVAAGYAISSSIVEPLFGWLTARALGVSPLTLLRALSGVLQASAVMLAAVIGARALLIHEGMPTGARLATLVVLGAVVYVPLCAWRAPEVFAELRRLRRPDSAPEAAAA